MDATTQGRRRRDESLQDLEKDRNALLRQPAPQDRKIPVSLHFFAAEYRHKPCGEFPIKTTTKILPIGHVEALALSINESHASELAFLRWLWRTFYPREEHTLGQGVEHWQLCTTLDQGTQLRPPTWTRPALPAWNEDGPVSIIKYKDLVHEGDGTEKFPKRSLFVPRSKSGRAKVLGIFLVLETRDRRDVDQAPLPDDDSDGDFLVTPSRRQSAAKVHAASSTARSTKAPSSTAPTSFTPSIRRRPSTATSFLDLTGLAGTRRALTSVKEGKISVDLPALDARDMGDHDTAWLRSPGTAKNDVEASVSEYGQERFQAPGHLRVRRADASRRPATAEAGGEPDVYEVEEEDFVTKLIGRKRKRPKPSSVEADGGPKRSNKGARQTRSKTPSVDIFASTRQSGRLLARMSAE